MWIFPIINYWSIEVGKTSIKMTPASVGIRIKKIQFINAENFTSSTNRFEIYYIWYYLMFPVVVCYVHHCYAKSGKVRWGRNLRHRGLVYWSCVELVKLSRVTLSLCVSHRLCWRRNHTSHTTLLWWHWVLDPHLKMLSLPAATSS